MSKQKIPPLSRQSPLQSNPSLSRKNIPSPTYIVKLEEVNAALDKRGEGGVRTMSYLL